MGLENLEFENQPSIFKDVESAILALDPDEPLICFSRALLEKQIARFTTRFPGHVSYAVKANPSKTVLRTLWENGITVFDVASLAEIDLVKRMFPAAVCHYHNPVKSRREIKTAYRGYGIRRFAVDNEAELEKIASTIPLSREIQISVRFKLPKHAHAVHDFSTKFGATPKEATHLLQAVTAHGATPIIAFHPGSQLVDGNVYARHIDAARDIIAQSNVAVATLNVGGGFPAVYTGSSATPEAMFDHITSAISTAFGERNPIALECEPGRGLVAPCMTLVTRVKLVKRETRELYLNEGIYGSLLEVNQASALLPHYTSLRLHGDLQSTTQDFTVFGPTCDPYDRLPIALMLPADIRDGDFIIFNGIGAYSVATQTPFNG